MVRNTVRAGMALMLAMALTGCAILHLDPGGRRGALASTRAADVEAAKRALRQRRWTVAITHAEHAVARDGADGDARALLATAYLRAGRFASAAQAFADTLALRQADARTALNLALTQIATGQDGAAVATLTRYEGMIPAADRGLALALAGAPQQGVEVLMAAMRVPGADARTRQNLALALALSGEWPDAFFMVGLDLPPAAARQRILDWMRFARPQGTADQVAALLKIAPAVDPGQPAALALHAVPASVAADDGLDRYMPGPADEATVTAALAGAGPPHRTR